MTRRRIVITLTVAGGAVGLYLTPFILVRRRPRGGTPPGLVAPQDGQAMTPIDAAHDHLTQPPSHDTWTQQQELFTT